MMNDLREESPSLSSLERCWGCGREIPLREASQEERYLCSRCHHLQVSRAQTDVKAHHSFFTAVVTGSLVLNALAGTSLCLLYLYGTGRVSWFCALLAAVLPVVALPAFVFSRRRNLALLVASSYLPVSLWAFLWWLAPGVGWEYEGSVAWGAAFFLVLGCVGLYLYRRDLRTLPRR